MNLIPCVMLINSAILDTSLMIKDELIARLPAGHELTEFFEVEWFEMHTSSHFNVMTKYVMATAAHFLQVATRFWSLAGTELQTSCHV